MKKFEIKIPEDILEFMKENIEYGWIDINGNKHIKTMKDFRRLYITTTVHQTLKYGIGTCIDQVNLMHYFFNKINVKNYILLLVTYFFLPNRKIHSNIFF